MTEGERPISDHERADHSSRSFVGELTSGQVRDAEAALKAGWNTVASEEEKRERATKTGLFALNDQIDGEPNPDLMHAAFLREVNNAFLKGRMRVCQMAAVERVLSGMAAAKLPSPRDQVAFRLARKYNHIANVQAGKDLFASEIWTFFLAIFHAYLDGFSSPSLYERQRAGFREAVAKANEFLRKAKRPSFGLCSQDPLFGAPGLMDRDNAVPYANLQIEILKHTLGPGRPLGFQFDKSRPLDALRLRSFREECLRITLAARAQYETKVSKQISKTGSSTRSPSEIAAECDKNFPVKPFESDEAFRRHAVELVNRFGLAFVFVQYAMFIAWRDER